MKRKAGGDKVKGPGRHIWQESEAKVVISRANAGDSPSAIAANWLPHLSAGQISSKMSSLRKAGLIKTPSASEISINKERGKCCYIFKYLFTTCLE